MAISPEVLKNRYKDLSVEELEKEYELLKKQYCFETMNDKIRYIINNFLNASISTNNRSKKIALEELLKEKTGRNYIIESNSFNITINDIINYITKTNEDPFWTDILTSYFQKLNNIKDYEKQNFLIGLYLNKEEFNNFTKEIINTHNPLEIYNKYKIIVDNFVIRNRKIG